MEFVKQGKEMVEQVKTVFPLAKKARTETSVFGGGPKHSGGELQPVIEMG